jgi:hypothetical protein
MSNPPNPSVVDVIEVDIPRPRNRVNVLDSPRFREIQERLMNLLTLEGERAA